MSAEETITLPLDVVKRWRANKSMNNERYLEAAVDAALWTPPVSHVEWIDCAEHPHPTDGTLFLAFMSATVRYVCPRFRWTSITHWALINLPEVTK